MFEILAIAAQCVTDHRGFGVLMHHHPRSMQDINFVISFTYYPATGAIVTTKGI